MQPQYREGIRVGWREEEKQKRRLSHSVRKDRKWVGRIELGREEGSQTPKEGGGKRLGARWWTWLSSPPAEALDSRHCGRLQDFQPNYRCLPLQPLLCLIICLTFFSILHFYNDSVKKYSVSPASKGHEMCATKRFKTISAFMNQACLCHPLIQHFPLSDYRQLSTEP